LEIEGRRIQAAYTLGSMAAFEFVTGDRTPAAGDAVTLRRFVWSLVEHAGVSELEVGSMGLAAFSRAADAACELLRANIPAERWRPKTAEGEKPKGPPDWYELWAIGRVDLKLTEREFWGLAPIQFDALCRRLEEASTDRARASAMICATLHNINRTDENAPLVTAEHFLQTEAGEKARGGPADVKQQREALRGKVMDFAQMFGARVTKRKRSKQGD